MSAGRPRGTWPAGLGAAALILVLPGSVAAQTPSMPATQRYGSGLLDIPVSSVLPHMAITGTVSGFFMALDRRLEVDEMGVGSGFSGPVDDFYTDGSLAIGLFDRLEAGMSIQSLGNETSGGDIWGLFGRLRLWEPIDQGLGLAVGARYLTSPDYGEDVRFAPGRLGFPDRRLARSYTGGTNLSAYWVATAYLRGFDGGPLPENDVTFTLGYGSGMFREGGTLDFYAPGHANGWFYGTSLHVATGERSVLSLMAEHNGFDVNVGAQVAWSGVRMGIHYLASNHAPSLGGYVTEYQKPKLGLLASLAICPSARGLLCRPRMMRRVEPDTIFIPPPPPDTVVVEAAAPLPTGEEARMCLSTGQNVSIRINEAGDTLVGPGYAPIESLRPMLDFAGSYAGGAFWFENEEQLVFEGGNFGKSPDTFPIDCEEILRVGVHEGVPVFADVSAERPLVILFVPVRPGVWQRYERGLR